MKKSDDEKLMGIYNRMSEIEKQYNDMTKEGLVSLLVFKDMMSEAFEADRDGHEINLWCYVSDESNVLYVTDTKPVVYFSIKDSSIVGNIDEIETRLPSRVYLSDGEVNVRVPDALRSIFPDLKFGDEPVRIRVSVSF